MELPALKREPIPIPHELTALPLFDTFFDLVDAHEAGGIETPTPAPLLRSVHELVQCITSSESSPPETWALAREWRDAVRAAHFAVNPPNPEMVSSGCAAIAKAKAQRRVTGGAAAGWRPVKTR
jgi:hypothetical protein